MTIGNDEHGLFRFGRYELDLPRGALIGESGEVELRPKSFAVLSYLVANAGRLAPKDEIIKSVWPDVAVSDASLAQCVSEIRLALGDQEQRIIKTVARRGYVFAAPLLPLACAAIEPAAPATISSARSPTPAASTGQDELDWIKAHRPAERRQLTVMACEWLDLAGLAARLDPEDLYAAVAARQQRLKEIAARYHAHVALTPDDGALVYFGYPVASEHDAEHAVRAGLYLLASAPSSLAVSSTALRVAVATGMVVITQESANPGGQPIAVGASPHVSRRLLASAPVGTLTVDQDTRQLVGRWFDYVESEPVLLGDGGERLSAWRVLGLSPVESRFDALRTAAPTALVGREEDIEFVLRRWQRARTGQGQAVLISGEPGIGKSRLATAVLQRLGADAEAALQYFCSPHHSDSPFHPIIRELERAAGFLPTDPAPVRLDKFERFLAQTTALAEQRAALAELVLTPADGRDPPLRASPQQRRKRIIDAIMSRFETAARRTPIVIVFEDAHWADPSSLDVLGRLIDGIAGMRALLIVTFRPDFTLPWVGAPQVGLLTLNRLATRECRDMISQVAGPRQLPEAAVEAIIARSDGVPLFLEELTRAVMEVGTAAGLAAPSAMPDSVKVPSVLNVSLMARLDRLGPARQVAQIAAAIGREFSYELLAAVTAARDSDLTARLDGLVEAGIVLREGRVPHASFRFKHALIQRAAYGTLLHDARRELHARIVHAIERACPDIRAREPEILARHCFEAGLLRQAVDCWREAGDLALRRSAVKEAVKHLGTALDVADRAAVAGDTLITSEDRLRLQTAYGHALLWAKDMQETVSVFARARELAANVSDARERFSAFYGLWAGTLMRGTIEPAQGLANTFLGETEGLPGSGEFAVAQRVAGTTAWHRGDFVRARLHLERALASYDPDRDGRLTLQFGLDLEVANSVLLAATLWPMGDVDRARRLVEQVTAKAPASGHALTQVYAHTYTFIVAMMSGDGASAMVHAQAMLDLCREHALTHVDYAAICHGWARSRAGDRSEAVAETRAALARLRERGGSLGTPWCLSLLAEVEWAAGEIEASLATVDASLAEAQRTGEHWYSAESERLRGEIRLARDPSNTGAAEDSFRAALAIAQQQKAKNFAIRAALSLARLQAGAGRRFDAVSVLALALTGPAPREELTEIGEARALLAKLRMSGST